ncbi:MAG TPA: type 1 glycerol-3-phosphate oxidase [Candidatus Jeotgalibaca pullicola]|nr:type 1 glycerol-3-phosphate oxidase [Candidatus Jeotgalibaca pullicola]
MRHLFGYKQRYQLIEILKNERFDLVIIGGGITGAGVALQAAASGLRTALIDMQDFSEGTSSRSTKLVHGGIRYLKQFDVEVVSDTVRERAIIQKIAPHIPRAAPMLLPVYDEPETTFTMFSLKVAMDLYDQLAGISNNRYRNSLLTKEEVLEREPHLQSENLLGAGAYLDYQNNDSRLVIENIKQAVEDGAVAVSRVKASQILHDELGRVNGVLAKDELTKEEFTIQADFVMNAAGPWVDEVRKLDHAISHTPQMRPTKGVHLVVDKEKLNVTHATYFDTDKQDGRMIFVIPRENKTYFGTTDTDYHGDLKQPKITQEDVNYLLEIINNRYPKANITLGDIEASWAGIRPLIANNKDSVYNGGQKKNLSDDSFTKIVKTVEKFLENHASREEVEKVIHEAEIIGENTAINPSAISRGSDLTVEEGGLLTLAGGKLTGYRLMAKGAMEKITELFAQKGKVVELIDSSKYPVSGGKLDPEMVEEEIKKLIDIGVSEGFEKDEAKFIVELYGSNAIVIFSDRRRKPFPRLSMSESLSLRYALEKEMVLTPVDYFMRRTNYLLFMSDRLNVIKHPVVDAMAEYFEWDSSTKEKHLTELDKQIAETELAYLK